MLVIRLQRTGRKGHANYRIVVQDARRTPTSGDIVMQIGHYDPHTKAVTIDKEKAEKYLKNGAQPSDRVIGLFKTEGIKMPSWVKVPLTQSKTTKSPEKLRKNRPAEPVAKEEPKEEAPAEPVEEAPTETTEDVPAETVEETPAEETPAETVEETPSEEAPEPTVEEPAPAEEAATPEPETPKAEETPAPKPAE